MATEDQTELARVEVAAVEVVDEKLVEQAAKHIKETLEETAFKGAVTVGDYLLKTFFGGDAERVRSHSPTKNASFKSLSEKCGTFDLPVSKTFLSNAVGVALMCKALPGARSYKDLPPSHQIVLLPLREPERVEKIAARAVEKELTVVALREIVQKEVAKNKEEGRGRPPKPLIVKTLDRSLKLFTLEKGRKSFTKAQVRDLSDEQAKHVRKTAEKLMESLKELVQQLKK